MKITTNVYTHKATGWTRTAVGGNFRVTPTDGSGDRTVAFMSRGSWFNLPNDDRAHLNTDRVVLVDGAPLPDWAMTWLNKANVKANERARDAFEAAMHDAEVNDPVWNGDY